jgi:site-specific recombinase XerD
VQAAALALPAQLAAIGPAALRASLDQPIASSTAARRLAALRALFVWAIREDHCASDPTATLETPRHDRRLPRLIHADADRLQWIGRLSRYRSPSAWP